MSCLLILQIYPEVGIEYWTFNLKSSIQLPTLVTFVQLSGKLLTPFSSSVLYSITREYAARLTTWKHMWYLN